VNAQVKYLESIDYVDPFGKTIAAEFPHGLHARPVEILQVNVGYVCNLTCKHCHVEAGPDRKEVMSRAVLERCLELAGNPSVHTVDITGGAPEMNPDFAWFVSELGKLGKHIIVRSNLTVLLSTKYDFLDLFVDNKVEVVASLPAVVPERTNAQRGKGVFEKCVTVMQKLNALGYGKEGSGLQLNLVHNPVGAYLPANQADLEVQYRGKLKDWDVVFNSLYCITNIPVGRYLDYLIASDNIEDYMQLLVDAYNPAAVPNVMCTNTLSVGWDGRLYDCDFNQMLGLPILEGAPNILEVDFEKLAGRHIALHNACYACTAGAGSSCQGTIVDYVV
jgi:radical SAM/Cys-rich protein